jgi:hypothetical protein
MKFVTFHPKYVYRMSKKACPNQHTVEVHHKTRKKCYMHIDWNGNVVSKLQPSIKFGQCLICPSTFTFCASIAVRQTDPAVFHHISVGLFVMIFFQGYCKMQICRLGFTNILKISSHNQQTFWMCLLNGNWFRSPAWAIIRQQQISASTSRYIRTYDKNAR